MTTKLAKSSVKESEIVPLVKRALSEVRDDMRDNPYIVEAMKVLAVGGYRSAIGCFWNAVVDDLRNKIIHRSLPLFNKSVKLSKEIKSYEDFQDHVNDDQLIEGAYKIGVIGWEAAKILRHAKETRHIFDGHPKSSAPSVIKVLAMFDDCVKYVLNDEYPMQIVDLDEYMSTLNNQEFDRNKVSIEAALGDLPEIYRIELVNRLFAAYCNPSNSSALRSNIGFVLPIVWPTLPRDTKSQVVRRVDQVMAKGNADGTSLAFEFVQLAGGTQYLSTTARKYKLAPLIQRLRDNEGVWKIENEVVKELAPYAAFIPPELLQQYVCALTHTYVGHMGSSAQFSRTDFYADGAAQTIPSMFEAFDDRAGEAFVECIRSSESLRRRIRNAAKLRRLRAIANIVNEKVSDSFSEQKFLDRLLDEKDEEKFFKLLPKGA